MILQLAPMEGVIDALIRDIYTRIGGYNLSTTEFVRVNNSLLPNKIFYKYCPELYRGGRTPAGVPVFLQLLGSCPDYLALNANKAVELGAIGIDMNFGCPARTVNNSDGGASLLKEPSRIYKLLSHLRRNIPETTPLSAKVRLGFDDKSKCIEIAKAVEESGVHFMGVHARTKIEAYKPPAHWEFIAQMREAVKVPILANGDIWTVEDWKRCKEVSGCGDFILGRGAYAFPELANEIRKINKDKGPSPVEHRLDFLKPVIDANKTDPSWSSTYSHFMEFLRLSQELYGTKYSLKRSKQWLRFLRDTYPEAKPLFEISKKIENYSEMVDFHLEHNKSLNK